MGEEWEYQVGTFEVAPDWSAAEITLNKLGSSGWEVVCLLRGTTPLQSTYVQLLLKRRVISNRPERTRQWGKY